MVADIEGFKSLCARVRGCEVTQQGRTKVDLVCRPLAAALRRQVDYPIFGSAGWVEFTFWAVVGLICLKEVGENSLFSFILLL